MDFRSLFPSSGVAEIGYIEHYVYLLCKFSQQIRELHSYHYTYACFIRNHTMYYSTKTIIPWGTDGKEITIEIDSNRSLPTIDIIGLPDSAVKESRERLRATFRYC
jgi:hypothetical protein